MDLSVTDLRGIDHAVNSIVKGVEKLIQYKDRLGNFDPDAVTDSEMWTLVSTPRFRLAQNLAKSYARGELGLFDYMVVESKTINSAQDDSNSPSKIPNFPVSKLPPAVVTASAPSSSSSSSSASFSTSSAASTSSSAFESSSATRQVAKWPPKLPQIKSAKLQHQVFTHRSVSNQKQHASAQELLDQNYERLEFLGDSVVNFTMTNLVYQSFRSLPEGQMTTMRATLICNDTLAEWATMYGLDNRIKAAADSGIDLHKTHSGRRNKIIADVMEAYIGALYIDTEDGPNTVTQWLLELAQPVIDQLKSRQEAQAPIQKDAKEQLYIRIGSVDIRPEYVPTVIGDNINPFTVEVRVKGRTIGTGIGPNLKVAGARAAMAALADKKVMHYYEELRRSTPKGEQQQQPKENDVRKRKHEDALKRESGPKDVLYSIVGSADRRPQYNTMSINGKFFSKVYLDGQEMGSGSGHSKKEAESNAAARALQSQSISG